jgi:hypothetical protein
MPAFLIATGPAWALLARLSEWRAERKHVSLSPNTEIDLFPSSSVTQTYDRSEVERFRAKNRGDISKR